MGYRSQVRSLIFGPKEMLDAFLTAQQYIFSSPVFRDGDFINAMTRYPVEIEIFKETTKSDNSIGYEKMKEIIHVLDLYGDSWKWYEGYEDVQAWNKFVSEAEDFGLDTEFLRIGEETNDIEHTSTANNDWLLSVTRTINDEMNKGDNVPLGIA